MLPKVNFCWKDSPLQEALREQFPEFNFLGNLEEVRALSNEEEGVVFILAELSWNHKNPAEFYGFDLVRELRLKKLWQGPIVLFSFLSQEDIYNKFNKPTYQILKTPGHYFFQLPVDWEKVLAEEYQGINENTLHDINNHFFSLEGVIDEEFHDLKNKIYKDLKTYSTKEEIFEQIKIDVSNAFLQIERSLYLEGKEGLSSILNQLIKDLKKDIIDREDSANSILSVNNYIGAIKRLLPKEVQSDLEEGVPEYPWSVLFVDDDKEIALAVKKMFQEKNIDCKIADNAKDTFQLLEEDHDHHIAVLICDYRMLNADKSWQTIQGYNILEKVYLDFSNHLALFSLTSFNKRTLLRIQKLHKMRVWSYSKDDVIGKGRSATGFNLFAEKVIEEGEKIFQIKRNQPKAKSWHEGYAKKFDRPLKVYYKRHRLSPDVEFAESRINHIAKTFFQLIAEAKHTGRASEAPEILPIQESIGIDKKRQVPEEEKLDKFRIKLIGRRIAIALYHYLEMDKGQVYIAMKAGVYKTGNPKESDNAVNQFFSTYMALSLEKDIFENLLPEESYWLKQLMLK